MHYQLKRIDGTDFYKLKETQPTESLWSFALTVVLLIIMVLGVLMTDHAYDLYVHAANIISK